MIMKRPIVRFSETRLTTMAGFSLVEVMVALIIGLIGVVVMFQVFAMFEGQKRSSAAGSDAIGSGSVALYSMQRDIQQSGWGFNAIDALGCTLTDPGNLLTGGVSIPLAPVTINPPDAILPLGEAGSDTLLILAGQNSFVVEGDQITAGNAVGIGSLSPIQVRVPAAFAVDDLVVHVPDTRVSGTCNLVVRRVTGVTLPAGIASGTVSVTPGDGTAILQNDRLFNLGANPLVRGYAVRKFADSTGVRTDGVDQLTICDYRTADCTDHLNWVPIADNIVSLRAQYRREAQNNQMTGVPDTWDQNVVTSGVTTYVKPGLGGVPEACAQMRLRAVRFAMVARSAQPERRVKDAGNNDVPIWQSPLNWVGSVANAADGNSAVAAAAVGISATSPGGASWPQWNDFRYKIFETTVPLRSVTMRGVPDEC